ncbi:hypothetical protein K492DRAFT_193152 [Lichtheimia hyalospora FSU 10163]|nr:hypothetical protein K492DRAFT_193152 [Lichtheimia hyalospora FSU 10163]
MPTLASDCTAFMLQPPVNHVYLPAPINTTGGQCSWCGKYGHQRVGCPYLKP